MRASSSTTSIRINLDHKKHKEDSKRLKEIPLFRICIFVPFVVLFVPFCGSLSPFRATLLCGDVHLVRGFVDLVDVDYFLDRAMIATLGGPQLLLVRELLCKWLVNLAAAFVVRVAPQTAVKVTIVAPTGIINDRIQAQRFELDARSRSRARLLADVAQPCWTRVALNAGLSDEDRDRKSVV